MMKCGLQPSSGSVGLLTCPTCCTDGNTITLPKSPLILQHNSDLSVTDLIDPCNLLSSSSESDDSSILSFDDEFEMSKFQNFEILDESPVHLVSHNLDDCQNFKMESDYQDVNPPPISNNDGGSTNQNDIMSMLSLISNRMMSSIQDMQSQLVQTDLKFTQALERINDENEKFKIEIRSEVQRLGTNTMSSPITSSSSIPTQSNAPQAAPMLLSSSLPSLSSSPPSSVDFQMQMMTMLSETFSKLTTIVGETKSADTKSDWPKFGGDTKKFKHWYLAIVAQLSLAPWKEFYDSMTNNIIKTTSNMSLNEKLYAKLLISLEGQVFQDMVSRKHLHGNGLLLLSELSQTYRPSHVPEVTAAKTVEFWSTLKRLPYETVDAYYNRFQSVLDDLEEAGEPIPVHSVVRQFIFTLGSDFTPIQNNHRIGLLPDEWKTTDWPTLLVLCRNYANSVRPQGQRQKGESTDFDTNPSLDRTAHHKKIKQWFMNPVKFRAEMEAEQAKFAGKCLYHLTKSHPTYDCYIKKECDKVLAARMNTTKTTSPSTGQLRNIKEDCIEEIPDAEETSEILPEDTNDTNESDLYYFSCIKNHYLRLV
jgi:hypothetical protein